MVDLTLVESVCSATPSTDSGPGPLASIGGQTVSSRPATAPPPMIPSFHPMARLFAGATISPIDQAVFYDEQPADAQQPLWLGGLNFQPPPAPMPPLPHVRSASFKLSGPAFNAAGVGSSQSSLLLRRQIRTAGMLFDATRPQSYDAVPIDTTDFVL